MCYINTFTSTQRLIKTTNHFQRRGGREWGTQEQDLGRERVTDGRWTGAKEEAPEPTQSSSPAGGTGVWKRRVHEFCQPGVPIHWLRSENCKSTHLPPKGAVARTKSGTKGSPVCSLKLRSRTRGPDDWAPTPPSGHSAPHPPPVRRPV